MQEKSCKPFAAYSNHVYGWCYENSWLSFMHIQNR
nr:MAG TPA: hypothetical protein [Caudoviricetes sp.]